MKAFKYLGSPYILIISFLFLLISGEQSGDFYGWLIMQALPHGGAHAWLAVAGIIFLLGSAYTKIIPIVRVSLRLAGIAMLIFSLFFFFTADASHYNDDTFSHAVPLITFSLFAFFIVCSLINNFFILQQTK